MGDSLGLTLSINLISANRSLHRIVEHNQAVSSAIASLENAVLCMTEAGAARAKRAPGSARQSRSKDLVRLLHTV